VTSAKDMKFDKSFDTIISCSMLEHDNEWRDSISTMLKYLKKDGILILSWGGGLNQSHCLETAQDGQFHKLPARQLIIFLENRRMYIHESRYEGDLPGYELPDSRDPYFLKHEGPLLVAFKDKKYAVGDQVILPLMVEDEDIH
jgi:SAM-dependent methyltransferase